MNFSVKPYAEMKDSGVPWIGILPMHWEVRRTKSLLSKRSEKGFPDEHLLASTQTKGVVRKSEFENRTVVPTKDLHLLKLVRRGDFVISLRSFQGGIEYAREQGIISPAYTILYPVEREHHPFLAHLFKSKAYIDNLSLYVTGIRQGQNVDYEKLARSRLPLPPRDEQTAIVNFLNHVNKRIRRFVRAKQELIALLEEQKRAAIHNAVTGKVDVRTGKQYMAYRDAGLEDVGAIPNHWRVVPLKRVLSRIVDCEHKTAPIVNESEYFVIRTTAVRNGALVWNGAYCTDCDSFKEWTRRSVPRYGDVIFTREAPAGEACVVPRGKRVPDYPRI